MRLERSNTRIYSGSINRPTPLAKGLKAFAKQYY